MRLPRSSKKLAHAGNSQPKSPQRAKERRPRTGPRRIAKVIERNIGAISQHREESEAARTREERIADWITWFSGNMPFVYFHAVWFAAWIFLNLRLFGLPAFDPFPYGLLTMIVSLEAIFLSTFVLVSQNRQARLADRRADLDLQTNLLAEYEVTRVLTLLDAIAQQLGVEQRPDPELADLKEDVEPEKVLSTLERHEKDNDKT